ncbi:MULTISPECIES: sigma-E factor negative regulatory protein [unclassified Acidovorax]|uniref:sigma-E factor negative regulatory protein n=1 Tax=unclassified Acidovorax TaxID=2684926 RepID=UPI0009E6AFF7|nr:MULTISPECIES: sigma-E factor negative regulatory protein [unclassified Acidovorax]MBD9392108.1 sigma-E factor negative regulatory protein [Acidovorax sp. ACV01]
MNKAVRSDGLAGGSVVNEMGRREQLSALADGQLQGDEMTEALAYAAQAEGHATWQLYHLVGDVLRSSDLAQPANPDFMARLRGELAKEGPVARPEARTQQVEVVAPAMENAANASVFRWKMVAGFASLAAVAAIGWTSLATLPGGGVPGASGGAQLVLSPEVPPSAGGAPVVSVADADGGQQVMIRDPRLDELLAAHKQFGSTSALQMPAGFLRNATFETPSR